MVAELMSGYWVEEWLPQMMAPERGGERASEGKDTLTHTHSYAATGTLPPHKPDGAGGRALGRTLFELQGGSRGV